MHESLRSHPQTTGALRPTLLGCQVKNWRWDIAMLDHSGRLTRRSAECESPLAQRKMFVLQFRKCNRGHRTFLLEERSPLYENMLCPHWPGTRPCLGRDQSGDSQTLLLVYLTRPPSTEHPAFRSPIRRRFSFQSDHDSSFDFSFVVLCMPN